MKKALFGFTLILILFSFNSIAADIYVNPGDDLDSEIKSASGGDVVLISPGTYGAVQLENKNFSSSNPLVIKSDGTGTVTILASSNSSGQAVSLSNCSYIVLEGVVIESGLGGLYIKASDHIIIKDNEIKNSGQEGCHIGKSSTFIDIIGNHIHHTGKTNSQWGEGIYVGTGSYGSGAFPDNCEHIWIENNVVHDCGNGEAINIKGESFHVSIKGNTLYNIAPGTSTQYNQSALTLEGANNSISNNYRLTESRDLWVESNEIYLVSGGYSNWDNGIMFGGIGCYIVNNNIHDCDDRGILGNAYATLDLPIYIYNNTLSSNGQDMFVNSNLKDVYYTNPGNNPNTPQTWYDTTVPGLKYIIFKCDDLRLSEGEFNSNWYLFFDMVRARGIKANLGLNGLGSDDDSGFWIAVNALEEEPYFEMWNHGYDHINLSGATQAVIDAEIIANQDLMRTKMGHGPIGYGAPFNAADINSVRALNSITEMQYTWYFTSDVASSFKGTNLIYNGDVEWDGVVSYSSFVSNYLSYKANAETAGRDYLTLQYHPPWTDATEREEIAQIVDYCLAQGLTFVSLSEYSAIQNGVTGTVSGLVLDNSSDILDPSQTLQLAAFVSPANAENKSVSWSSSNESVASVSAKGLVSAVATGTAIITATTEDGGFTADCSVTVNSTIDYEYYNVSASSIDGENFLLNTRDDDLGSRWSASGDGEWIKFDMQQTRMVDNVEIAFYIDEVAFFWGIIKTTSFDVQISMDDTNWTEVYSGSSSGKSLDLETFDFTDTEGRYIRIVGHGNSDDDWNSLTEMKINIGAGLSANSQTFDYKRIKLYPNPTIDQNFTIDLSEYSNQDEFAIALSDLAGKVIYSDNIIGGQLHQIYALHSAGLYFLKVQSKEIYFIRKLIVR